MYSLDPPLRGQDPDRRAVLLAPEPAPAYLLQSTSRRRLRHLLCQRIAKGPGTGDARRALAALLLALSLLVGWCVGVITEAGTDRRFKIDSEVVNFYVHYEIDETTTTHRAMC